MDSRFFPFFFPATLISAVAGPEEAKNQREKVLRLIRIRLTNCRVLQKSRQPVKAIRRKRGLRIRVRERQATLDPRTQRRRPSVA